MSKIGVVEGFFGPAWPEAQRLSYAAFIQQTGGGFYIYAPKRDPKLRKAWREPWDKDYLDWLASMARHFQNHNVSFGVGLSPFGLGSQLSKEDETLLMSKLSELDRAGVQLLGLFFDDMPTDAGLARSQRACVSLVRRVFTGKIIFCPSYYTPDPILEKVFGKMPENYWNDISAIPLDVAMAWTGPKVISPEIGVEHLESTMRQLKRRPFLWENIFANDGPKNCKFLKLKPFAGRERGVESLVEAFAFNMMNQPELSKIVFLASRLTLEMKTSPEAALNDAIEKLCSPAFAKFLESNRAAYLDLGLDQITEAARTQHLQKLQAMPDPAAREVSAWLKGEYIVGPECLTD